jgi:hypothetical protein
MKTSPDILTDKPPDIPADTVNDDIVFALDVLSKWENGILNDVSPADLLYLRATQCIRLGLSRMAVTEATA